MNDENDYKLDLEVGQVIRYYYYDLTDVIMRNGVIAEVYNDYVILTNGNKVMEYEILRIVREGGMK